MKITKSEMKNIKSNSREKNNMENYNTIQKVFNLLQDFYKDINRYENKLVIHVQITTIDGIINDIYIEEDCEEKIDINYKFINYNNEKIILLSEIAKIKISTDSIENENIIDDIISNINQLLQNNKINTKYRYRNSYQNFNNDNDTAYIEDYIKNNIENVQSIGYHGNLLDKNDLEVLVENTKVISGVRKNSQSVVNEIKTKYQDILTNSAKTVEVAKPIKTESKEVISEIKINNVDLISSQSATSVVGEISENKGAAITDIRTNNIVNVISNIDKQNQIVNTQSIQILELKPVNNYIKKEDLNLRPLRIDPTGEGYVGVILDDGTFEPLNICLNTYSVLDNEVKNILCNIDTNNQLKNAVEDIEINSKDDFVKSIDIISTKNVIEYSEENKINSTDLINTSKISLNNIINKDETTNVVTKEKLEKIETIDKIKDFKINYIDDISTEEVVKSIDIVDNIEIKKENIDAIKRIDQDNEVTDLERKDINGELKYIGNGIMVVKNSSDATIFNTSKITSINQK